MKLPHRRQFLYLTAAPALPAASCIARAQAYRRGQSDLLFRFLRVVHTTRSDGRGRIG